MSIYYGYFSVRFPQTWSDSKISGETLDFCIDKCLVITNKKIRMNEQKTVFASFDFLGWNLGFVRDQYGFRFLKKEI